MSNEDIGGPPRKGLENVLVLLPTGQMASLDQLLAKEGQEHVEINVSQLKTNDLVIADYANEGGAANDNKAGRFSVKFTEPQWAHLGIAQESGPTKDWIVEVSGLPAQKSPVLRARYGGAGFGGSMHTPDVIATGRSLIFHLPGRMKIGSPFITKLAVVRQEKVGETIVHRLVKPQELTSSDEHIQAIHERRMGQYANLMERFGIAKQHDFRNGSDQSNLDRIDRHAEYEDGNLSVTYHAGMAMGNSLIIYNKRDHSFTHYNYYNYKGKDALQVGYSDLKGDGEPFQPREHGQLLMGASMVHRSRSSIVSYNTSPRIALDAIQYDVSGSDATALLHIPLYRNWKEVMTPDIQIYPDNSFRIPEQYPLSMLTEQDPAIFQKISSRIAIEKDGDTTTVVLGGVKRKLRTPEEIFSTLQI